MNDGYYRKYKQLLDQCESREPTNIENIGLKLIESVTVSFGGEPVHHFDPIKEYKEAVSFFKNKSNISYAGQWRIWTLHCLRQFGYEPQKVEPL